MAAWRRGYVLMTSVIAAGSVPLHAQDARAVTPTDEAGTIVVTGSILRRQDAEALPITALTAQTLQDRGVNTVSDALQLLANNGGGNLPVSFTANGAFAAGASAVSLRGLTTSSSLVLIDGLRMAYYPLADDGTRNFVDLNTIPSGIIERIETLKDGGSSTYGADAVAGVVNIIIRKQIKGFEADASSGLSQRGDAAENRVALTFGVGDLADKGFNFYVSGEYERQDALYNRSRGFPFNTANLSSICGKSLGNADAGIAAGATTCANNNIVNGIQADGSFLGLGATTVPVVRPFDPVNQVGAGEWSLLNARAGCGALGVTNLSADQRVADPNNLYGPVLCQQDLVSQYSVISPTIERFGVTARMTANVNDRIQAYAMFTYYQARTHYSGAPQNVQQITTPGSTGVTYDTRNGSSTPLLLPVYVCPQRANCDAVNGVLNPNNPFAAQGLPAQLSYRLADRQTDNTTFSRSYRGALGLSGSFGKDWDFNVQLVGSRSDLTATSLGYIFVQRLLDVVADGTYNFVNPAATPASVSASLTPANIVKSTSELYQAEATLRKPLFDLPGGPLQAGVGASVRYEALDAPSANPDLNGPTNRWFTINPVGAAGSRYVYSGFFEVSAPIISQLNLNFGGRYDSYSSGQKNFAPKVSALFKPVEQVALRGSWSRGFRIPSFSESNGLPTTGFINYSAPAAFQALHGNNSYGQNYNVGLTTIGTPGLQPERARNITGGIVVKPFRGLSLSADYWNIQKTNVIVGANYNTALTAYFAGQPIPAGFTVTPDVPDPQFPGAALRPAFVGYGFVNANRLNVRGIDFAAALNRDIGGGVRLNTSVDATYIIKFTQTFPDGSVQRYDGTLGQYVITSGSGTPKWRGNWQVSLDSDRWNLTSVVYYTSGYENTAEDVGGTRGDCFGSAARVGIPVTFRDGVTPIQCRTKSFAQWDLTGSIKVQDRVTLYANVLNVLDTKPPLDFTTYGGTNYNPAWANGGIVGRFLRVGVRIKI